MKHLILIVTCSSIFFSNNLEAHLIKLINESRNSDFLVRYSGQQNASIKVPSGKIGYLEAPDEKEGIIMLDLIANLLGKSKNIGTSHLYTNYFDKVHAIEAKDEPNATFYVYQEYATPEISLKN